ncbi:uncharacterized protein METZ01_LOCUS510608, partial [marine metagenome]
GVSLKQESPFKRGAFGTFVPLQPASQLCRYGRGLMFAIGVTLLVHRRNIGLINSVTLAI